MLTGAVLTSKPPGKLLHRTRAQASNRTRNSGGGYCYLPLECYFWVRYLVRCALSRTSSVSKSRSRQSNLYRNGQLLRLSCGGLSLGSPLLASTAGGDWYAGKTGPS